MTDTISCTPPEMREEATKLTENLLPEKSKSLYLKAYTAFRNWCITNKATTISENVLLAYFSKYASDKKASSSWAHYSMLKSTILLKENINISKYFKLIAFLKKQNVNYTPKKSSVFTQDEITNFITHAPDDCYITAKVSTNVLLHITNYKF